LFFDDPFAMPASGVVAVREYGSSPPPPASLGLGRKPTRFSFERRGVFADVFTCDHAAA
jgi:hypothetical protein